MRVRVGKIDGGVQLQIGREIIRETEAHRVARTRLVVHGQKKFVRELVRVTQNALGAAAGTNRSGYEVIVGGVVTVFQDWLDPSAAGRPVDRTGREQMRSLLHETKFGTEHLLTRPEAWVCALVHGSGYPITLRFYAAGIVVHTATVAAGVAFKLPVLRREKVWEFEIETAYDVNGLTVAMAIEEMFQ